MYSDAQSHHDSTSTQIHPLFTRQDISLDPHSHYHPFSNQDDSWPSFENHVSNPFPSVSYSSFPMASPFQPQRLSPPPMQHFKGVGLHRPTLAGSLDPATGIFYRTPEHPRLRTAQACEKCRTRKAKVRIAPFIYIKVSHSFISV